MRFPGREESRHDVQTRRAAAVLSADVDPNGWFFSWFNVQPSLQDSLAHVRPALGRGAKPASLACGWLILKPDFGQVLNKSNPVSFHIKTLYRLWKKEQLLDIEALLFCGPCRGRTESGALWC
jgi:hypothetical protein